MVNVLSGKQNFDNLFLLPSDTKCTILYYVNFYIKMNKMKQLLLLRKSDHQTTKDKTKWTTVNKAKWVSHSTKRWKVDILTAENFRQ